MTTPDKILTGLLCTVFLMASAGATDSISTAEYRKQLDDLRAKIEEVRQHPEKAGALQADVPDHISVKARTGEYPISYGWLKKDLSQFQHAQPEKRANFLNAIEEQLEQRRREAQAYDGSQENLQAARQKVEEILSRREFRRVHGPTLFDIWLEKVLRWIDKILSPSRYGSATNDFLHILVYGAIAIALSFFAIWLKRRFDRSRDPELPREIVPFAPSARGWRSWLAAARQSAQQQDWRNAVHLAYWAGISFLEEHGAWRPDRARTPREYLRLLKASNPQHSTLTALTRNFEVIWYGQRDAGAGDFDETLGQLEKLGCK